MFTGIVEEIGTVLRISRGAHSAVLMIRAARVLEGTMIGDSISVNGVCLTVTELGTDTFSVDVMHETLDRSSLATLRSGSRVDLERAMPMNGRFGGHIVSGHIDGTGRILSIRRDDNAIWYTIAAQPSILRYIVEKGSVAIDGISLTVARVDEHSFSISAIPHTISVTVLADRREGDVVNLENDIIGKYIEKLMQPVSPEAGGVSGTGEGARRSAGRIDAGFLAEHGFLS